MPLVSVIIPSYNHSPYIKQCIDSVLCQIYTDFEIIVVDDGSTDGTLDILRSYGNLIRLVEQKNCGTQAARNKGIRLANGHFIAILDSDDIWLPKKLAAQMDKFDHSPEVSLVYSFAHTIDVNGAQLNKDWHLGIPVEHPYGALAQLLLGCFVPALTAMFRRRCIDDVGFFDESLLGSGDWDLWLRIAAKHPIACVESPLALYRIHPTNTTKMLYRTKAICAEHEQVLHKAFLLPEVMSLPQYIRNQALARINLRGAEAEAISGDAKALGVELKKAIELDPTLLQDLDELGNQIIHWAHLYAAGSSLANPYQYFVSEIFSKISPHIPSAVMVRRRILSNSVMGKVFTAHSSGNYDQVKKLLLTGLFSNPQWLHNRGVWSIIADTYLESNTTARLRNTIRKLQDLRN